MAEQDQEQNKTEEATPFKLRRAREKGSVARSMDLGYVAGLAALAAFMLIAGGTLVNRLALLMRQSLSAGIDGAADPRHAVAVLSAGYWPALQSVALLGGTIVAMVLFFELVQLRGVIFTSHPLKPDFNRINPAKGLKRLFSLRMLKEALKNVLKLAAYGAAAFLVIRAAIATPGRALSDAQGLAAAMHANGTRLLFLFIVVALFVAAIDQVLVRREFAKQMRMSRRELTREAKDREGEPRIKRKRKQLHAEFASQAAGMGKLPGSDLLVVNPHHVAVGLAYDPARMAAPKVMAKARNHFALALKREAARLGIPIVHSAPLARRLFAECEAGFEIHAGHYQAVAEIYLQVRARRPAQEGAA